MKLCECGCGQAAPIAKQTSARSGVVKGQPLRFVMGHFVRTRPRGEAHPSWRGGRYRHASGYTMVRCVGHARAKKGYVLEHILVVEHALGQALPVGAEVHHVNEVRSDNRGRNLVICENHAFHLLLHARMAAYRACGNPDARQCWLCRKWDVGLDGGRGKAMVHRTCGNAYRLERQRIRIKKSEDQSL